MSIGRAPKFQGVWVDLLFTPKNTHIRILHRIHTQHWFHVWTITRHNAPPRCILPLVRPYDWTHWPTYGSTYGPLRQITGLEDAFCVYFVPTIRPTSLKASGRMWPFWGERRVGGGLWWRAFYSTSLCHPSCGSFSADGEDGGRCRRRWRSRSLDSLRYGCLWAFG